MKLKLKANQNLTLTSALTYKGMPVLPSIGYLIEEYLEKIDQTIDSALNRYPRVCAIRVDIRLPNALHQFPDDFIRGFFKSLRQRIKSDQQHKATNATRSYNCTADYFWVREASEKMGGNHYHLVILVNKDAYHTLGDMNRTHGNMYARIVQSLASVLGVSFQQAKSSLNVPDNPIYYIDRNSPEYFLQKAALFTRASYFAKHRTKVYTSHLRHFGCSQYYAPDN